MNIKYSAQSGLENMSSRQLAHLIDHTLLKPEARPQDVLSAAEEALSFHVASVCISPSMVPIVSAHNIPVPISTVVGFPSGKHLSSIKTREAQCAVEAGACEVDMVIDVGAFLAGETQITYQEILECRQAIPTAILKVIIESAVIQQSLGDQGIIQLCQIVKDAGADFIKTSTGFHPAGGADLSTIMLMAQHTYGQIGIKASGGIRTYHDAIAMVNAGATRLGTSHTKMILTPIR